MTDDDLFDAHAAQLAARIAEAEARGDPVPAEARAMLASLRELADATAKLRASFGERPAAAAPDVDAAGRDSTNEGPENPRAE